MLRFSRLYLAVLFSVVGIAVSCAGSGGTPTADRPQAVDYFTIHNDTDYPIKFRIWSGVSWANWLVNPADGGWMKLSVESEPATYPGNVYRLHLDTMELAFDSGQQIAVTMEIQDDSRVFTDLPCTVRTPHRGTINSTYIPFKDGDQYSSDNNIYVEDVDVPGVESGPNPIAVLKAMAAGYDSWTENRIEGDSPLLVQFTAAFSISDSPVTYEFDLDGDGSYETDNGDNPLISHTYSQESSTVVGVRVTDPNGSDTDSIVIKVGSEQPAPQPVAVLRASLEGSSSSWETDYINGIVPLKVYFAASGSTVESPATYRFDLDGDGEYEYDNGTSEFCSYTYETPGDYDVGLEVTDANGTAHDTLRVVADSDGELSDGDPGQDPGAAGNPTFTLIWSWSDSSDPQGPDIDLWVQDPVGGILSSSRDWDGLGPTPEGGRIDFDDQGQTADYEGDGGGPERAYWPTGQAPAGQYDYGVRYFAGSGHASYELSVYVDGSKVQSHTGELSEQGGMIKVGSVSINEALAPVASITADPTYGVCQLDAVFDAGDSTDPGGGGIVKYEWDFSGNGEFSYDSGTESSVDWGFGVPQDYHEPVLTKTVAVRVTNEAGLTDTAELSVEIFNIVGPDENEPNMRPYPFGEYEEHINVPASGTTTFRGIVYRHEGWYSEDTTDYDILKFPMEGVNSISIHCSSSTTLDLMLENIHGDVWTSTDGDITVEDVPGTFDYDWTLYVNPPSNDPPREPIAYTLSIETI